MTIAPGENGSFGRLRPFAVDSDMSKTWRALGNFALRECRGWRWYEVTWLAIAVASLVGVSLRLEDTLFGVVSAVAGVISVILTGKGKLSAYLFGVVNCTLYGIIAYGQTLYGETMLNLGYYLPVQFYGFLYDGRLRVRDVDLLPAICRAVGHLDRRRRCQHLHVVGAVSHGR